MSSNDEAVTRPSRDVNNRRRQIRLIRRQRNRIHQRRVRISHINNQDTLIQMIINLPPQTAENLDPLIYQFFNGFSFN
jgi:hypothetical protein